jgi:isopentenyl-diphosphate Delta-isomerase
MTDGDPSSLLDPARDSASTNVVLLDRETDRIVGEMEKLKAHRLGRYHSAISVLLFRSDDAQLMQRRTRTKYHGGGLWANACCSHPFPGEDPAHAASRRLNEELGVVTSLTEIGVVRYRCRVIGRDGAELVEYEHVRLFAGFFDGRPQPNPQEVDTVNWIERPDAGELAGIVEFTPWFRLYLSLISPEIVARDMEPIDFGFFDLGKEM